MPKPKVWFEIYQMITGKWYWRLVEKNKKIFAVSGQGYKQRSDVIKSIDKLQIYMTSYEIPGLEITEVDFTHQNN